MRIIVVTQRVDPQDPVLGATVAKLRALAERCSEVVVIADHGVPGALPDNCRVRSFRSRTRFGRGVRFGFALLAELVRRPRPAAVVAHMCPIYAVLAAPLVRPLGVRVVLWYAHWNRTRTLELAVRMSTDVASVDAHSVPLPSPKVVGIGHGIEVADFTCGPHRAEPFTALALGRYSPAKGLTAIIDAIEIVRARGIDIRLVCHGTSLRDEEQEHLRSLHALVRERGLEGIVTLGDPVARTAINSLLHDCAVLVNNSPPRSPDKVVYEACAACTPIMVSSAVLEDVVADLEVPLWFPGDDAEALADGLESVWQLSQDERERIGRRLRERVVLRHSVESWAGAIVGLAAGQPPPSASS